MLNYSPQSFKSYSYQEICAEADGFSLPLNVYLPDVQNEKNQTAVICIHGGAWTSSLKKGEQWEGSWMRHHAYLLSTLGYIGIEITHRSITGTDIREVVSDVTLAHEYIHSVIKERHGIKSFYAIGDSAGGHLGLMSAFFSNKSLRPEKLVACNPVSDLTDEKWQLGTTDTDVRRAASPLFFFDATETKILIIHGDNDKTVPITYSENLNRHLLSLGCETEYAALPGAEHAFILYGYRTPTDKVNLYMEKAIKFFNT